LPSMSGAESRRLTELINELSKKLDEVMKTVESIKNEVSELKERVGRLSEAIDELAKEVESLGAGRSVVADELFKERLKQIIRGFLRGEGIEI